MSLARLLAQLFAFIWLCCMAIISYSNEAHDPAMPENSVHLTIITPERDVAYTVGDVIQRTVVLNVKKPYKLIPTSLPIIGYQRRYKGQITGIELRHIAMNEVANPDSTTYTLHLSHQIFTNNTVAKFAFLPAETLRFTSDKKGEIREYRIPEWLFRVSPIAVYGSVELKDDISPLRRPYLLSTQQHQHTLTLAYWGLALSLLGLLYILGQRAWLPFMGKPFAKAYRIIKRQPSNNEGLQIALNALHDACNQTAKMSVFSDNLDHFIASQPAFAPVRNEILQFMQLSTQYFYAQQTPPDFAAQIKRLSDISLHCRDCERGLIPQTSSPAKA